jgi:tetratricopeptide (TPR) repeat protein
VDQVSPSTSSPAAAIIGKGERYRAFISYSHRDKAAANWLHHTLETYRIPKKLVGSMTPVGVVPRRLSPIFRDRDELSASHDLGGNLTEALRTSLFLLVICSPASAKSRWVNDEILAFKRFHGEHRVLALIVGGRPRASDRPGDEDQECFPHALRNVLGPDGNLSAEVAHPIAADIREGQDGRTLAKMKLIAGLTGLRLDAVVQREAQRRTRRLAIVASASTTGMVLAGGLALYANIQRIEADRQRAIAERETKAARAAADFLIGTFRLTNTATENPRTVTAVSILNRGAARVRAELAGQPEIEARMLDTVGSAYINLGLVGEARSLLQQSLPDLRHAGAQGARAMELLAVANIEEGHLNAAMAEVDEAERQLGPIQSSEPEIRANLERARARILFANGDPRGGLKAVDHALALYHAATSAPPKSLAIALQTKGLALSDDGQFAEADKALTQSLAIFRRALGDADLLTGAAWQALALNDLAAGHLASAETRIGVALDIERKILSDDNPALADTIAIQGQVFQGEHKLEPAAAALRQAIAIYDKAFGKPTSQAGIDLVYLGLVESEQGHTAQALADLDRAKHDYDVGYGKLHPNHGDLLVNRARVLAHAGRRAEAIADCAAGVKILDQTLGADAAFTKANVDICAKL